MAERIQPKDCCVAYNYFTGEPIIVDGDALHETVLPEPVTSRREILETYRQLAAETAGQPKQHFLVRAIGTLLKRNGQNNL